MPIRWSAVEVVEAMDEVEGLLDQAEPFLAEAQARARKALSIQNLPEYMSAHVDRVIYTIETRDRMHLAVDTVRKNVPRDALAAERQSSRTERLHL